MFSASNSFNSRRDLNGIFINKRIFGSPSEAGSFEVGLIEGVLGIEPGTAFGVTGRIGCFLEAVPLGTVETLERVAFFMVKTEVCFQMSGEL